jgi:hypothetical protein
MFNVASSFFAMSWVHNADLATCTSSEKISAFLFYEEWEPNSDPASTVFLLL